MIALKQRGSPKVFVDAVGRRVLIGLTIEETAEFEGLDRAQAEPGTNVLGEVAAASLALDEQLAGALRKA